MISIPCLSAEPRSTHDNLPGSGLGWWLWSDIVLLRCTFGHVCWLPHEISADGTISPSIVCPVSCPFHEFGKLEGWTLGARPKQDKLAAVHQKARDLGYVM